MLVDGVRAALREPVGRTRRRHRDRLPEPRADPDPEHRREHLPQARALRPGRPRALASATCRRASCAREVQTAFDRFGVTLPPLRSKVSSLSGGQRQAVAITRAVMWGSHIVIMDEPAAALGVRQTELVLSLVERLRSHGVAIVFISHNMQQVLRVADRIAVMRLGQKVADVDVREPDDDRHRARRADDRRGRGRPGRRTEPLVSLPLVGYADRLVARARRSHPLHGQHASCRSSRPARPARCGPGPAARAGVRRARRARRRAEPSQRARAGPAARLVRGRRATRRRSAARRRSRCAPGCGPPSRGTASRP